MLDGMTTPAPAGVRVRANGHQMPLLGLGVWQIPDGRECIDAVAAAEMSLRSLGIDRVDLYLVPWPQGGALRVWDGRERALQRGLTRSIGVSNYSAAELETVLAAGATPPVVNQVEFNLQHYRRGLLDACTRHQIAVEACSPLGTGRSPNASRRTQESLISGCPALRCPPWTSSIRSAAPTTPRSTSGGRSPSTRHWHRPVARRSGNRSAGQTNSIGIAPSAHG